MKSLWLLLSLILFAGHGAFGVSIAPERAICPRNSIAWFNSTDEHIVAVFGDGRMGCWRITDGRLISSATIKDYSFRNTQLALSKGANRTIAVLSQIDNWDEDDYYQNMTLYEIPMLNASRTVRVDNMIGAQIRGITSGGSIIMSSYHASAASAYDLSTGKEVWRIGFEDRDTHGTAITLDGTVITRMNIQAITARSITGNALWAKQNPEGVSMEVPNMSGSRSSASSLLVLWRDVFGMNAVEEQGFVALSAENGQTIWEHTGDYNELLAVSQDGKMQVFQMEGKLRISQLPLQAVVQVEKVSDDVDAHFTPDATRLLILPSLKVVERNPDERTYTITRTSNTIRVVNTGNGNAEFSFPLQLGEQKDIEQESGHVRK